MGRSECSMRELIKIETYWNVNSVPAAPCLHPADLNRDILER